MAASFGVRVEGVDRLVKALKGIDANLLDGLRPSMLRAGEILRAAIVRFAPASSGSLRRSFKTAPVDIGGGQISVGLFSDLPYARIQNQGGTIRPKTGKNLAIPVTGQARKLWPRDWPSGALSFQIRKGKKLLFDQANKLQYVLKPSVTLKGSGYLEAAAKAARPDVVSELVDGLEDLIKNQLNKAK